MPSSNLSDITTDIVNRQTDPNDPNRLIPSINPQIQGQMNYGNQQGAQLQQQDPWYMHVIKGMLSDPGLSPIGLGVVAESQGGSDLVKSLIDQITNERLGPKEAALRFVSMKYPKLMSKIPWGYQQRALPEGTEGLMQMEHTNAFGSYIPRKILVDLNQHSGPLNTVNVAGHELTHGAIQAERTSSMLSPENYKIPPSGSPITKEMQQQWQEYWNQPAEVNARRGGGTVEDTFLRFLHKYPELKKYFGK